MENTNVKNQFQVAELQLVYKTRVRASERPKIKSSKEAYEILKNSWDDCRIELLEQFKVMLLNRANKVLGIFDVSSGGISGTVVDPRLIFATALTQNILNPHCSFLVLNEKFQFIFG